MGVTYLELKSNLILGTSEELKKRHANYIKIVILMAHPKRKRWRWFFVVGGLFCLFALIFVLILILPKEL